MDIYSFGKKNQQNRIFRDIHKPTMTIKRENTLIRTVQGVRRQFRKRSSSSSSSGAREVEEVWKRGAKNLTWRSKGEKASGAGYTVISFARLLFQGTEMCKGKKMIEAIKTAAAEKDLSEMLREGKEIFDPHYLKGSWEEYNFTQLKYKASPLIREPEK